MKMNIEQYEEAGAGGAVGRWARSSWLVLTRQRRMRAAAERRGEGSNAEWRRNANTDGSGAGAGIAWRRRPPDEIEGAEGLRLRIGSVGKVINRRRDKNCEMVRAAPKG